ncbi:MAG: hypothetical protein LBQ18_03785 [Campylobacteraceae bacterium]|jgi:hypothetical protein|nr:hypothetical protein [Campylobacteraceae bacterium]
MTLKQEIFRAIFVILGLVEISTNLFYLLGKEALSKAKFQHQEMPKNITMSQLKIKVIFMLVFGVLFFMVGIFSYIAGLYNDTLFFSVLLLFTIYALCEALYYKYWRIFGFFTLSAALTIVSIA